METKVKSKIEGNFNWRVPTIVPSFIEGEDAEAFLEEFNGRADADYKGNSALKVLTYSPEGKIVRGSNPFAVVLTNQILRKQGIRTATPAQLEMALAQGMPLAGTYEDTALVVRGNGDTDYASYNSLAKDLYAQIQARGIEASPKNPIVVPLTGLELVNTGNSFGLAFTLSEDAGLIEAPELVGKNHGKTFSKTDERGIPIIGKGNRVLYARSEGLSRLVLGRDLNAGSDWGNLADSNENGRVVFVSGGADASDFLAQHTAKINSAYEARKSELAGKFNEAMRTLDSGYKEAQQVLRGGK